MSPPTPFSAAAEHLDASAAASREAVQEALQGSTSSFGAQAAYLNLNNFATYAGSEGLSQAQEAVDQLRASASKSKAISTLSTVRSALTQLNDVASYWRPFALASRGNPAIIASAIRELSSEVGAFARASSDAARQLRTLGS